jgi:hypothetical protein
MLESTTRKAPKRRVWRGGISCVDSWAADQMCDDTGKFLRACVCEGSERLLPQAGSMDLCYSPSKRVISFLVALRRLRSGANTDPPKNPFTKRANISSSERFFGTRRVRDLVSCIGI